MQIPVGSTSAVALVSGGMDSVTLAYKLIHTDGIQDLHLISFDYGQRHRKELEAVLYHARELRATRVIADVTSIQPLLSGSALTSLDVEVPEGHYTSENMKVTVVPNRNMIMLAIAAGYAVSHQLDVIAAAVHAGDHFIYPDCRPAFIEAVRLAILLGNEGFNEPFLYTPFINQTKADIVRIGDALGVPWEHTWSCYKGGNYHCRKCGTCIERHEAFDLAGIPDPTIYIT